MLNKGKATITQSLAKNGNQDEENILVEELEITSRNGQKRKEIRERVMKPEESESDEFIRSARKSSGFKKKKEKYDDWENSDEESKHNGEKINNGGIDPSYDVKTAFNRLDRDKSENMQRIGIDECTLYAKGPINKYIGTSNKIPTDEKYFEDPSKIVVTKIAVGYSHMIVLLDNGTVFVSGNNTQGQLNLDPNKYSEVEGLKYHKTINRLYEVIDIGCGSNHTVFIVRDRNYEDNERKILTCGYHGCLGVLDVNEDEYRLQTVKIPSLDDYDKIEFLICKFNSSAVLDNENNLYYWGDDFDGFRERVPEKKKMFGDKRIVDISFGFRHAVALLEDGSVYTWGDGKFKNTLDLILKYSYLQNLTFLFRYVWRN